MSDRNATLLASLVVFVIALTVYIVSRTHIPDTPWIHGLIAGVTGMTVAIARFTQTFFGGKDKLD